MVTEVLANAVPPIFGAVVAGGLIGLEREWRGRAAGFRTHILVSLASALLMLAALSQEDWAFRALPNENITTDPIRMAHGVLTGIGFLCAGVIFRTGFSVHGLTTAASLCITAAVGLLFGAGLYGLGALGAGVTAVILGGLRLIDRQMPGKTVVEAAVCWEQREPSPHAAVQAALRSIDADVRPGRFELMQDGRRTRRTWRLKATNETELERLAELLNAVPGVTAYRLNPRDD